MTELLVTLGLIVGLVVSHELGFWLGPATQSVDELFDRQVVLVRASTAALVAFLIGFAFSGAASRFIDRVDIIVEGSKCTRYRLPEGRRHLRTAARRAEGCSEVVHR